MSTRHPAEARICGGGCAVLPLQVIFDDGNIPDLSALANIRSVQGPLIIYGTSNASLTSLAGLEGITVRTEAQTC